MRVLYQICGAGLLLGGVCLAASAQEGAKPAAAVPTGVAATVDGQPISEVAVQRGLKRLPPAKQAEARVEIVNYLINNILLDQYLLQLKIEVPAKEIDERVNQIREEIKKGGQTFDKVMQELMLTEEELRAQLTAELRWEKYVIQQATDKVLHEVFDRNPEMFDGSMVRARHILLTPSAGDAQAGEKAKAQLLGLKKQVEEAVAQELAKLPPNADNNTRAQAQAKGSDAAFAELARKESACPSKEQGGDLGFFPRVGSMVEPFAKAAFDLKPYQMSDVVATQFGYHLILTTDRRPGSETKFDDIKDVVKEVYGDRLRDYLCNQLKPRAKIVINPPVKQAR